METSKQTLEAGAYVGRQQAFAVIANQCSAAQAQALKLIRESRAYEDLDLTWDEFCPKYFGFHRTHADHLIRQHKAFGEAFFKLAEIAKISSETFRHIAPKIDGETIEIDGQKLTMIAENAPAIRAGINKLRAELRAAQTKPADVRNVTEYRVAADALVSEVSRKLKPVLPMDQRAALRGLSGYIIEKWTRIRQTIDDLQEIPYYSGPR
jgi:hypothetical protein